MRKSEPGIIWYLSRPRILSGVDGKNDALREFSYTKTLVPSRNKQRPKLKRTAWDIFYKDEFVVQMDTLREVREFIKEKIEN